LGGIHFPLDHYYRDLSHLPFDERVVHNFDDPQLIECPLLAAQVAALAQGKPIERPLCDLSTYIRVPEKTEPISAADFLVVEGLFALYSPELLPLYQLRICVDTPEVCFERRLKRDVEQRGRNEASVQLQYDSAVRPSSLRYVRPSAQNADLPIDGTEALDWKVEQVLASMRERGLLRAAG
jgi:uridine kinase